MKKTLAIVFFQLFCLVIFSQDYGFGLRGGYNFETSSISEIFVGKESLSPPSRSGITRAFFLDLGVTNKFSIEANFQYDENETDLTSYSFPDGKIIQNGIVTTRIALPILGKLRFGSDVFKLNIFAGPSFTFLRSKFEEERIFIEKNFIETNKIDIDKSSFDSYQYRNLAGFGLSIHLNNYVIFGNYRYIFNFNDLESIRQLGLVEKLGSNIGVGIGYYW